MLEPFDTSCPRCARLAQSQPPTAPPTYAPYGTPGATAASHPIDDRYRNERRAPVLFLFAALAALVLIVVFLLVRPRSGGFGSGGSLLVITSGNPTGGSLTGGQAVGSGEIQQRLTGASAKMGGDVEVSLAWNSLSDLDLQVLDPSGELITAHNPHGKSGRQDVDANPTLMSPDEIETAYRTHGAQGETMDALFYSAIEQGAGSSVGDSLRQLSELGGSDGMAPPVFSKKPIEHIYFAKAPRGTYTVFAHCYNWREHSRSPLPFTIQVRYKGQVFYETSGTLGPESFIANHVLPVQVCQFAVR